MAAHAAVIALPVSFDKESRMVPGEAMVMSIFPHIATNRASLAGILRTLADHIEHGTSELIAFEPGGSDA
ncbi:hypothetical protein [Arthrobacter sp. NPDC090010]|uniref:hypothetical protein n=1 Tax=Arthrobacter sp. NPDC090010 TaxID=3363942 RepID=UPI00380310E1